ncbi:MAG: DNA (cytosine-5-)-methyltransferase [Syntrophorhabdales bacterium]
MNGEDSGRGISAIDLFCGIGGLTHGMVLEGISVVAGVDADSSCKYAFEKNNAAKFIEKGVEDIKGEELSSLYPPGHTKVLVGCAPCQPFSKYTRSGAEDEKWKLLDQFSRLIGEVDPDVVSMENVPELATGKRSDVFGRFVAFLEKDYRVSRSVVYCPDYGIPQSRRRLVLFASKYGKVEMVDKTYGKEEYRTVKQAIGHLPRIGAGEVDKNDPVHRACRLSKTNIERIRASSEGGTWRDWDETLKLPCHRKVSGKTYPSIYGRMSWNELSPTITTQAFGYGNGRFGHPEQDRAISLREAALLQTFPSDYAFVDPGEKFFIKKTGRHIGNAVPVELGRMIGRSIVKHLEETDG